jgi:hypothetical protein
MPSRVAVLEEIARSTKQVLAEIKTEIGGIRSEMHEMRRDMLAGFDRIDGKLDRVDGKRERDFRLLFAAIIVATLGLAGLIARTQHWI